MVTVKKGIVSSNIDYTGTGRFYADIPGIGNGMLITYVSPAHSPGSGFVMIPEEGAEILVQSIGDGNWYYMGTVVRPPVRKQSKEQNGGGGDSHGQSQTATEHNRVHANNSCQYETRGKPQIMAIKYDIGGIAISKESTPELKNHYIAMEANSGKQFKIEDSPKQDSLIIKNEHDDMIRLSANTAEEAEHTPVRGVDIRSTGDHTYECTEGTTQHIVFDGRELILINCSQGTNKASADGTGSEDQWGNIDLESTLKDINILVGTEADDNMINLFAMGNKSKIQINSKDVIVAIADGNITITSKKAVDIIAEDNLNLQSKSGSINLKAASDIKIQAGGSVGIDGSPMINLNEGVGNNDGATEVEIEDNDYDHPSNRNSLGPPRNTPV